MGFGNTPAQPAIDQVKTRLMNVERI